MSQEEVFKLFRDNPQKIYTSSEVRLELEKEFGIILSIGSIQQNLRKLSVWEIEIMDGYSKERNGQFGRFYRLRVKKRWQDLMTRGE